MASATDIFEERTFRLLPAEEIGFAKPAIAFTCADGSNGVRVSHKFSAPEPELARKADDPGYWRVQVWLPLGATPTALVPDPNAALI